MHGKVSEETVLVGPIRGFFGSVRGDPRVRNAILVAATVESLDESSTPELAIAGILSQIDYHVQAGDPFTRKPIYIVDACKTNGEVCWSFMCGHRALPELSWAIPKSVRELCDRCFEECRSLSRVTFVSSSCLEQIGEYCFSKTVIAEVSIPDSVRELCDRCFSECQSLRRVTFGSSSSLERIGKSCFEGTVIEEVSIPDSVRELCDCCFAGCTRLRRVNFGSSSSVERIGVF